MDACITVRYSACDGARITRRFKTREGARRFAVKYVGEHPEIGFSYAISGDGVGKVTVSGCTLEDLFGVDFLGRAAPRRSVGV